MGPNTSQDALSGKLKEVERLLAAVQAAESQGRWIRRFLVLGVVVFLVGFTWLFYQRGKSFMSDQNVDKLTVAAQKRLADKHTQDRLNEEVRKLLANVQGPVMDAFQKRMDKDSKKMVDRMNKEGDYLLQVSLPQKVDKLVTAHYEKVLMENQGIFEEEFPELKSEKARQGLANSVAAALSRLSRDMYAEDIKKESETLVNTWRNFPESKAKVDDELEEKMITHLADLFLHVVGDLAPPQVTPPQKTPSEKNQKVPTEKKK